VFARGWNRTNIQSSSTISLNEDHIAKLKYSSNNVSLYIDGVLQGSTSVSESGLAGDLSIGIFYKADGRTMISTFDGVLYYVKMTDPTNNDKVIVSWENTIVDNNKPVVFVNGDSGTLIQTLEWTPYNPTGTYADGFNPVKATVKKYGSSINGIFGDVNANGVLQQPTEQTSLNFTGIKEIPANMWRYKFSDQSNIVGVSFPDLETVGATGLQNAFYATNTSGGNITLLSMPKLKSVGSNALNNTFYNQKLTDVDVNMPLLQTAGTGAFASAFYGTDIKSFTTNALTSIVNNTIFQYAFQTCTNEDFEVHFNNLASINAGNTFASAFYNSKLFQGKVAHPFPDLESINGTSCFSAAFAYLRPTRMVFDKLKYIGNITSSTSLAFYQAFNYSLMGSGTDYDKYGLFCPSLLQIGYAGTSSTRNFGQVFQNSNNRHTLHFYDLTTVNNSGTSSSSYGQFYACGAIRVYMPKVTSLGTYNQYCFYNSTTLQEIHFGIENQATIQAMSGYASKFGATNATIYFDMVNHITVDGVVYDRDGADCDLDNWYFAWKNGSTIIYTTNFKNPAVGDSVYTKSGETYTASGTITAIA